MWCSESSRMLRQRWRTCNGVAAGRERRSITAPAVASRSDPPARREPRGLQGLPAQQAPAAGRTTRRQRFASRPARSACRLGGCDWPSRAPRRVQRPVRRIRIDFGRSPGRLTRCPNPEAAQSTPPRDAWVPQYVSEHTRWSASRRAAPGGRREVARCSLRLDPDRQACAAHADNSRGCFETNRVWRELGDAA